MKVSQIMTSDVKVIRPDSTIQQAANLMDDVDAGSLPVCDGSRLVGMITDRDIVIRSISAGQDPTTARVRDAMTSPIEYCYADQSLEEVAQLMKDKQIRRLPVVDQNKDLVGIVSLGDLAVESPSEELTAGVTRTVSESLPYDERASTASTMLMATQVLRNIAHARVLLSFVGSGLGLAMGAGVMYILDPQLGRRRRALARDQLIHFSKVARRFSFKKARHITNRAKGVVAEARTNVIPMVRPMVRNGITSIQNKLSA